MQNVSLWPRRSRLKPLGTIIFIVAGVLLIFYISVPNLLRSRIAANEASAVGSMRTINTAITSYAADHPDKGYPEQLSDLSPYVDSVLANGTKSGYNFHYVPQSRDALGAVKSFKVVAMPQTSETGQRRFSTDERGAIAYQASAADSAKLLDGETPAPAPAPAPPLDSRRMIQKVSLSLVAADPVAIGEKIRRVAYGFGGYVDSMRVSNTSGVNQICTSVRVPSARLDEARRQVHSFADRVTDEQEDARDVTSQYVDLQSNLRNFHAEESQYLEIMRRSGSIKDTLAVAEKLADVRGRIEHAQGQLNVLGHQTEMAVLEITVATEPIARPVEVRWHPLAEMKAAFWDAADDLSTYANFMIAVLFRLPVFILWAATLVGSALGAWRFLRWAWSKRMPAPAPAPSA